MSLSVINALVFLAAVLRNIPQAQADRSWHHNGPQQWNDYISLRIPPSIYQSATPFPGWVPPNPGFYYGNWALTHTSAYWYFTYRNMEASLFPLPNATFPGPNSDLTDWQLPLNYSTNPAVTSQIIAAYGIDHPVPNPPTPDAPDGLGLDWGYGPNGWSWQYNVTGVFQGLVGNVYEFMGYGEDPRTGSEWVLLHETPVAYAGYPSCLDFECRMGTVALNGSSYECEIHADTVAEILAAVKKLGNAELAGLAERVVPLVHDGARNGQIAPYPCDATCMNNTILAALGSG